MSIFAYARRLQAEFECDTFVPTFGIPVDQDFGDVASEGVSTDLSRSDHRHGMPTLDFFVDDLETTAIYFEEFCITSLTNDIKAAGTTVLGGRDDEGELGGFGTLDATTAAAVPGLAGVWIQNLSGGQTGNTTTQTHPFKRTTQFFARVRPVLNTTQLASMRFACGFILTTTTVDISTISDGVYFFVETNGAGVGTYHIIAKNNTSTTDVDTEVSPRTDGTDVLFDSFRITFDGTAASFFINEDNVGAIDTNIPPGTRKTCGFGAWLNNASVLSRTMVADVYGWTGQRSYTE